MTMMQRRRWDGVQMTKEVERLLWNYVNMFSKRLFQKVKKKIVYSKISFLEWGHIFHLLRYPDSIKPSSLHHGRWWCWFPVFACSGGVGWLGGGEEQWCWVVGWSSSLVCFGLFGDVRSKRGVQEAQAQKNRKEKEARE